MIKTLPAWHNWLKHTLPYLTGPRILEVSFGTGYLPTRYADRYKVFGVDYNLAMIATAHRNLADNGLTADLQQVGGFGSVHLYVAEKSR